ncbi:MAG: SBBP repeat-containing protein [Methylococcales bacterium]
MPKTSYSADGDLVWVKRAGGADSDEGAGIAMDSSGNAYITGDFSGIATFGSGDAGETMLTSDNNSNDLFIAKYTTSGDLVWAKRAGGTDLDSGNGIAVDDSGNAYITGIFSDTATFGLGATDETMLSSDGFRDIFAAKYTADGELVWAKRAGGTGFDEGNDIAVDDMGIAYVTGSFSDAATFGSGEANETTLTSDGSRDIFVAKYAADGDLVSVKRVGGTNVDSGNGIAVDDSDNVYVTGIFNVSAIFGLGEANQTTLTSDDSLENISGSGDIFVAKFSDAASDNPPVILDTRVAASSDDAEENTSTGKIDRGSSDLELVDQGRNNQLVGIRFNGLNIPQGATITNASIQFQADETHSGVTTLLIKGEATDNALTFTNAREISLPETEPMLRLTGNLLPGQL